MSLSDVVLVLSHYIPDLFIRLQLPAQPTPLDQGQSIEDKLQCTSQRAAEIMIHAETQLFIYILLIAKLIDDGDFGNAKEFGDFIYLRLKNVGIRTLDHLVAKAFFLIALAYERKNLLPQVRSLMFDAYKTCCLRHD